MGFMKRHYGFENASALFNRGFLEIESLTSYRKAQYEMQFKSQKIRQRGGNATAVYMDGKLVPTERIRKETLRQGYMSSIEQAQADTPQTPPGVQVRTPPTQPVYRLVFGNLPIFQFNEHLQSLHEASNPRVTGTSALTAVFRNGFSKASSFQQPLSRINSLLPTSALLEEPCAQGLAIERVGSLSTSQCLSLTTFLISNNFPGETDHEQLYQWLRKHWGISLLKALTSIEGPTAEALLESLFRCAIEAQDTTVVRYPIKSGGDPNGHKCQCSRIPDTLSPLQFACIHGNIGLALDLVEAGSSLDQPGAGWKSSILAIAILGAYMKESKLLKYHCGYQRKYKLRDEVDTSAAEYEDHTPYIASDEQPFSLLNLVNVLLKAGANININLTNARDRRASLPWFMECGYSPLTAASMCRSYNLVCLFIDEGGYVMSLTEKSTSALHECLYSWHEDRFLFSYRLLPHPESQLAVINIVTRLLS
ncbi:hypothetical protein F5884DRAFT_903250 [Xylogone sp. PMI_703]|nr:hypothetical protein F5884DRAFT_903250 [Xylogone sp. PMI_703]